MKSWNYFFENNLPACQYFEQFTDTAKVLEVGKVYRQNGTIFWADYEIIFVGDGIAIGKEVANGNNNFNLGEKCLFVSEGIRSGWKYHDDRPAYRLVNSHENF